MAGFIFKVFGFNVESCMDLPHLPPGGALPDIRIRFGHVAWPPEEAGDSDGKPYQIEPGRATFWVPGLAAFQISNGNEITIESYQPGREVELTQLLLGSAFAGILHQRGFLVLHGSTIETDQGAVVFSGDRGIGKSTLAAAFVHLGYRLLTDDVCAMDVDPRSGNPVVRPSYPLMRLHESALGLLGLESNGLALADPDRRKFFVPLGSRFSGEPLPLRRVFDIRQDDATEPWCEKLNVKEAFLVFVRNLFRTQVLSDEKMRGQHFPMASHCTRAAGVYRLHRPKSGCGPLELARFIESVLQG